MRLLIAEDDFTSRILLQRILEPYGTCDIAVNGTEAMKLFFRGHEKGNPYALICLDIMMPVMDGMAVLKLIRQIEKEKGIAPAEEARIVMTTALDSPRKIMEAYYQGGCTGYIVKPIEKARVVELLAEQKLI